MCTQRAKWIYELHVARCIGPAEGSREIPFLHSSARASAAAERSVAPPAAEDGTFLESYLTHFDAKFRKRQIPRNIKDPEALYMELIELKHRSEQPHTANWNKTAV